MFTHVLQVNVFLACSDEARTNFTLLHITESVDSVCRDGTDMPYVAIQTEAWKTLLKQQL